MSGEERQLERERVRDSDRMFVAGVVSIILFYILILAVGIWAGNKQKSTEKNPDTEELMLAGRNIGLIVGIFTMTGKVSLVYFRSHVYVLLF